MRVALLLIRGAILSPVPPLQVWNTLLINILIVSAMEDFSEHRGIRGPRHGIELQLWLSVGLCECGDEGHLLPA